MLSGCDLADLYPPGVPTAECDILIYPTRPTAHRPRDSESTLLDLDVLAPQSLAKTQHFPFADGSGYVETSVILPLRARAYCAANWTAIVATAADAGVVGIIPDLFETGSMGEGAEECIRIYGSGGRALEYGAVLARSSGQLVVVTHPDFASREALASKDARLCKLSRSKTYMRTSYLSNGASPARFSSPLRAASPTPSVSISSFKGRSGTAASERSSNGSTELTAPLLSDVDGARPIGSGRDGRGVSGCGRDGYHDDDETGGGQDRSSGGAGGAGEGGEARGGGGGERERGVGSNVPGSLLASAYFRSLVDVRASKEEGTELNTSIIQIKASKINNGSPELVIDAGFFSTTPTEIATFIRGFASVTAGFSGHFIPATPSWPKERGRRNVGGKPSTRVSVGGTATASQMPVATIGRASEKGASAENQHRPSEPLSTVLVYPNVVSATYSLALEACCFSDSKIQAAFEIPKDASDVGATALFQAHLHTTPADSAVPTGILFYHIYVLKCVNETIPSTKTRFAAAVIDGILTESGKPNNLLVGVASDEADLVDRKLKSRLALIKYRWPFSRLMMFFGETFHRHRDVEEAPQLALKWFGVERGVSIQKCPRADDELVELVDPLVRR